ncbi:hypothetical protein N0V90_005844 [Kalmusia sp. IMI 367209]|nr:hypothetical protein N0V90_005844 [Kalmusia sp. IMI 367209]
MPFFNPTPSLSLFYTLHGPDTAPPLILVHGWCCNSHDWDFHIPLLSQTYRVIAFDHRGHGQSSAPTDIQYRIKDYASDIVALLHHLQYDKDVVMVGHSLGGLLASFLSVTQKDLIRAFVLVDPFYWTVEGMVKIMSGAFEATGGDVLGVTLQFFPNLYGDSIPEWMKTWYLRRVEETPTYVIRQLAEGTQEEHTGMSMAEHLRLRKESKVPRLVVYSSEEDAEKEKGLGMREGDKVVVMGGVGHWPHHAKADEFNETLGSWLKNMEASRE